MAKLKAKKNSKLSASQLVSQARFDFQRKDYNTCIQNLLKAIELYPKYQESYMLAATVARAANNKDMELKFLQAAEKQFPNDRDILLKTAVLYEKLREYDRHLIYSTKLLELFPDDPEVLLLVAFSHIHLRKPEKSLDYLLKLLELRPKDPKSYEMLGGIYEILNMTDESDELANRAKQNLGDDVKLLLVARMEFRNKNYARVVEILEGCEVVDDRMARAHAASLLAKSYEKLGEYDKSWGYYELAQGRLEEISKDIKLKNLIEYIMANNYESYSGESLPDFPKYEFDDGYIDPIFIVGFPRSGTTLTEQSLVASGKFYFPDEIDGVLDTILKGPRVGETVHYPKSFKSYSKEDYEILRRHYFEFMEEKAGMPYDPKVRMVDKMPANIVSIGMIKTIFPNSKIVMVVRDPRDVCLSCFFQNFIHNDFMKYFYSYEGVAGFYDYTMDLYYHYKRHFGDEIFEVKYEDMVEDFEGTTKKLYEFIEEEWTDDVMRFYEKKRDKYNVTPNYAAINKPIYKSSKQRWKNYEKHIKQYIPLLEKHIKAFGYEV